MKQSGHAQNARLLDLLSHLTPSAQQQFMDDLESTIALGARALVLAHLHKADVPAFEKIIESGDDAIIDYGSQKVPEFELKWFVLLDEIYSKALRSLKTI